MTKFFIIPLIVALVSLPALAQPSPKHDGSRATKDTATIVFLVDHSDSMRHFQPPDTIQACLLHLLDLARFSGQPCRVAVIFFGGDGVTVLGDEQGQPTAAHAALRQDLINRWPKPAGATPMDEAFEEALRMIRRLPRQGDVSVVLMSDGQPSSGRLRPKDFPSIAKGMERRRQTLLKKYQGFPPEIGQEFL